MSNKTKIIDYGYDGEGVGKLDGKVCFIPHTVKGEEVEFEILQENSKFIKGKLSQVLSPSKERQTAQCPFYDLCGGCSFQHISYENEINIKKELLKRQLTKCNYNDEIKVFLSPKRHSYRNKLRVFVSDTGIGLKERGTNKIVDINRCLLCDDLINYALPFIRNFVFAKNLGKVVDYIELRQENWECFINFFFKKKKSVDFNELASSLGDSFSLFITFDNMTYCCCGQDKMFSEEMGLKCSFAPRTFHQINKYVNSVLYRYIIDNITQSNVVNCYSGAGVLSGILATRCKEVYAIEMGISEHNDAENLKKENNLYNLTNLHGDCGKVLPKLDFQYDAIVIDPPRKGVSVDVCNAINESSADKIVYVSCNASTMVRDIANLKNFHIQSVALFDMFALTSEFESVVVLNRNN